MALKRVRVIPNRAKIGVGTVGMGKGTALGSSGMCVGTDVGVGIGTASLGTSVGNGTGMDVGTGSGAAVGVGIGTTVGGWEAVGEAEGWSKTSPPATHK